jgi:chromosome segregation ATPase
MDSMQIPDSKTPMIVHDFRDLISRKIIINRVTLEFLNTQKKLSEKSIELQEYSVANATQKLIIMEQINTLYEQQLNEFDESTQQKCIELYDELNKIHQTPMNIYKLTVELNNLDDKLRELAGRIEYLESTMPQQQAGIQYKVKLKQPHASCGTEDLFDTPE